MYGPNRHKIPALKRLVVEEFSRQHCIRSTLNVYNRIWKMIYEVYGIVSPVSATKHKKGFCF